jgi:hypothetical protein
MKKQPLLLTSDKKSKTFIHNNNVRVPQYQLVPSSNKQVRTVFTKKKKNYEKTEAFYTLIMTLAVTAFAQTIAI